MSACEDFWSNIRRHRYHKELISSATSLFYVAADLREAQSLAKALTQRCAVRDRRKAERLYELLTDISIHQVEEAASLLEGDGW
jgi:hypothetical protein